LDYVVALHAIDVSAAGRADLLGAWRRLPLYADVLQALERLHAAGLPLLILSNGARGELAMLLESAGVTHLFDAVLSSEDAGVYKPHPTIYQLVTDHTGLPAVDMLFVSANGFDIAGARRFGFTVARANRTGEPLDRLGEEPHLTVADFSELAAHLLGD
jgi:2-haloacid dehalogenase